jgi:hypothetical protein
MVRVNRWLNARTAIAAVGLAAVVAGVPAPSLADHERCNHRSHYGARHDRVHAVHRARELHRHARFDAREERRWARHQAKEERRWARHQAKEERRRARHNARFHRYVARHHHGLAWIFASRW